MNISMGWRYKGYSKTLGDMSFMALLLAFLAGCGGGGGTDSGSGGSLGPPDTTAPSVTAMTPGEDSLGLAINSRTHRHSQ